MHHKVYPVILSGGVGKRLWPSSREKFPKQFIKSSNEKDSFFVNTIKRVKSNIFFPPTIIGNFEHRFLINEALEKIKIKPRAILLEPFGKNTSAAVTLSSLHIFQENPDAIVLVMPSDHLIKNETKFNDFIKVLISDFDDQKIHVFGIKPTKPSSEYGYIKVGKKKTKYTFNVESFYEKPKIKDATKFLKTKKFYWNSGMFLFSSKTLIEEMNIYSNQTLRVCKKLIKNKGNHFEFITFPKKLFSSLKNEPIDKSLMEKTSNALVSPVPFVWSDVGSWSSYWDAYKKDKNGNIIDKNVYVENVTDSLVKIDETSNAIIMGVDNISIVKEKDSLLVTNKNYSHNIKNVLKKINKKNLNEDNSIEYRPWGSFENIKKGNGFLVKILRIKPGSKISLQYHKNRSEHWVITKGKANILLENKEIELVESESIYVKVGQKHRISNNSNSILEIVEIQIGKILDENDIIRIDDEYGRI